MADALDAAVDHVAVAVADLDTAGRWWGDQLGGGLVSFNQGPTFGFRQYRYANGARVELLAPPSTGGHFVAAFLERFGSQVHHLTLKVPDLAQAVDVVEAAGLQVRDLQDTSSVWREAFLRPSQVGGLIVQLACSPIDEDAWAERVGHHPQPPAATAPAVLGPTLRHPDLSAARRLWTVLGADVAESGDGLVCRWPGSVLTVNVVVGQPAGPVSLRLQGGRLPAERPPTPTIAHRR